MVLQIILKYIELRLILSLLQDKVIETYPLLCI